MFMIYTVNLSSDNGLHTPIIQLNYLSIAQLQKHRESFHVVSTQKCLTSIEWYVCGHLVNLSTFQMVQMADGSLALQTFAGLPLSVFVKETCREKGEQYFGDSLVLYHAECDLHWL